MNQIATTQIGLQELTAQEVNEVSGGILCLLLLPFAAGYAVGTMIYNAATK